MTFDVTNLYRKGNQRRSTAHNARVVEQIRDNMVATSAHGYREEEAVKQYAAEQERLDAVRAAEEQLSRSFSELRKEKLTRALNLQDDPSIFHDPEEPKMLSSQAEANEYNKQQVRQFLAETPEYYPDPEGKNLNTISDFLERNGHSVIVGARKLQQVFNHLTDLGLLIQRPASVAASVPAQHVAPAAPVRPASWDVNVYPYFQNPGGKASDLITGWDPNGSGERVTLTRLVVEKMDLNEFKYFGRPTVQQTPEWALVESREMVARQFTELGRKR